jgi:hypothetical protein
MDKNKNQGSQRQDERSGQSNTGNLNVGRSGNEPKDNNPSGKDKSSDASQQSSGSQSGEWPRPLTNQDEQKKSTNIGGGNRGEGDEQSEGDERIKPYKNIGDDSEEVEKKTPTME